MRRVPTLTPLSLFSAAAVFIAACSGDAPPPQPTDTSPIPVSTAAEVALKRLTRAQYTNAIQDVLGQAIAVPISLEPDDEVDGFFSVGSSEAGISALGVERYESAAYVVAEQAMVAGDTRDAIMPCKPNGIVDEGCAENFVGIVGRRLFRRPLDADEVQRYATVANTSAQTLGDFHEGLGFALAGMLQSPHFLFRVELGSPNNAKQMPYGDYEMATRLAFFLWNTTPDDELLDAAERGELMAEEGLRIQVDRLLASERARAGVRNFFLERFNLYELDALVKDAELFTSMSADLGPDAREETLRTVEDLVFDRQADYRTLFTSGHTIINRRLAALYGVPAPTLEGFGKIEFSASSPRAGLLGQLSVLALHAHSVSTSATLRGLFIRSTLLCQTVPAPPANVNTTLPEPSNAMPTLRDRIGEHLKSPSCAACHQLLDPIGLGLERFDGIGKFREQESGFDIDPSGDLDDVPFADARELGSLVAAHPDTVRCLVRHLYRYATSHYETAGEDSLLKELMARFEQDGFRIKPLLRHIALSEGFRFGSEAPTEAPEKEAN
ncbi:MAG: DUF1592 domain-containing protein [Polyangiaceae bacterium]